MQRRAEHLDGGGGGELGEGLARDLLLELGRQALREDGAEQRGHVERGEDGHAVAHGEEHVRGQADGARRARGPEQLDVDLVLVDADADVGSGAGGELERAGRDLGGVAAPDRRRRRVERVGRQVRAAVHHEDEGDGLGEEERVRPAEEGREGRLEGVGHGRAARGVFHDRPGEKRSRSASQRGPRSE